MKHSYKSAWFKKLLSLRSRLFTAVILAATLASCNNEEEVINQRQGQPLQLNVRTAELSSRGIETSTSLSSGKTIGIRLAENGKTTYDKITYDNIPYTTDGTAWAVTQQGYSEPLLSATEGTVYAYYPWSEKVKDLSQVPVETASQTDYMYAEPATGCNAEQTQAELTLKHALSVIRLSFAKGSYTGEGSVTRIAVKGSNIATTATMNAIDGSLSGYAGTDAGLGMDVTLDVDDAPQHDFIIVPVISRKNSPVLTVTMDGEDYSVTLPEVTFVQGCIHTYTVTVNNKQLVISDVTVGEWGYNTQGQPVVKVNGKTVTFTGNTEGIAFHNSVADDGTLTVKAVPVEEGKEVADVTISGSATLDQQLDSETGVLTVTLSNVTADQNIDFNGTWYQVRLAGDKAGMTFKRSRAANGTLTVIATPDDTDDYVNEGTGEGQASFTQVSDETTGGRTFTVASQTSPYTIYLDGLGSAYWIITKVNAASTTSATQLLTTDSNFSLSFSVSRMKVDGTEITPVSSYTFDTEGEHEVRYRLDSSNETSLPTRMFYAVTSLVSVAIPDIIQQISDYVFYNASNLRHLSVGKNVNSMGIYPFYNNSLETITVHKGNTTIDSRNNCNAIIQTESNILIRGCTMTVIPEDVVEIKLRSMWECKFTYMRIPDSVKTIGNSAFMKSSELQTIDFGSGLTSIANYAFNYCPKLTTVISRAMTAPSLSGDVFYSIPSTGTLTVPTGATGYEKWISDLGSGWTLQYSDEL